MNGILEHLLVNESRGAQFPYGKERVEHPIVTDLPVRPGVLDRDFTAYRDGVRWSFKEGQVFVNQTDVNHLINDNPNRAHFFMNLAEALNDYRKRVIASQRHSDQLMRFEKVIDALLMKLLGKLKKFYDQKISGLSWTMEEGQLILNGVNVQSFLSLYRIRKTDKARRFLRGLRGRLAALLENRRESPDYERIRDVVQGLYQEIDMELAAEAAAGTSLPLLPSFAHAS